MPERLRAPQADRTEASSPAASQPADDPEALDPAQPHSLLPEPQKKLPAADPADPAAQPSVEESASQLPPASQAASAEGTRTLPGPPDRPGLPEAAAAQTALGQLPPPPPPLQDAPATLTSTHPAAASAAQLPSALPGLPDRPLGSGAAAAAMGNGPQHADHSPPAPSHPPPAQHHTDLPDPTKVPASLLTAGAEDTPQPPQPTAAELQTAAPAGAAGSAAADDITMTELDQPHAMEPAAEKPAEAPAALEASAQAQPPVPQPDAAETGQPDGELPAAEDA